MLQLALASELAPAKASERSTVCAGQSSGRSYSRRANPLAGARSAPPLSHLSRRRYTHARLRSRPLEWALHVLHAGNMRSCDALVTPLSMTIRLVRCCSLSAQRFCFDSDRTRREGRAALLFERCFSALIRSLARSFRSWTRSQRLYAPAATFGR